MADDSKNIDVGPDQLPAELLNARNRELTRLIKQREAELSVSEKELEEQKGRTNVLGDHLKNVQTEVYHTQRLVEAKSRELETEEHMKMVAEREAGRVKSELSHIDTEALDLEEKINSIQNSIFRANERLDAFKLQMNWNQEELDQWALARRQKEEDADTLEKYRRADESKIKELNLAIEKQAKIVQHKRHELETEITETQASQIELDKTAIDFQQLHKERQELVRQWEETIAIMKLRDDEIKAAGEQFAEGRSRIKEKQDVLTEKASFLEIEQQNNREVEAKQTLADRNLSKLRSDYSEYQQAVRDLEDEIEVIKNTLSKASTELSQRRARNTELKLDLESKKKKLQRIQSESASSKQQLEEEAKSAGNLEQKQKQVEDVLKATEGRMRAVEKELQEFKEDQYKQSQELFKLRQEEASMIAEISGAHAQSKNMVSKVRGLDQEAFKQQELLYSIEFQVQQMERKVSRASGDRTAEEKEQLNAKIQELQRKLDAQAEIQNTLNTQVKRVHDEVRSSQRVMDEKKKDKSVLEENSLRLTMENEALQNELKALIRRKEDLMVQHDVLKLQIKRLRDILHSRADELLGMENRKFQLKMAMQEREKEVGVHKDVLRAELKAAEDERRRIASELREREVHVEKLKRKFEILLQRLKPGGGEEDGEEDGEMSQAQFIIRAAQEREELQKRGDELDAEIQRLEREERALDKTLLLLKRHNVEYSGTFKRADSSDTDVLKKQQMEQKKKDLTSMVNRRAHDVREYMQAAQSKQSELQDMEREASEVSKQLQSLVDVRSQLTKELAENKEKVDMQTKQLVKLMKDFRKKKGAPESQEIAEEIDFNIAETRERNRSLLLALGNVASRSPDMQVTLDRLLAEYGLQMPSRPPSSTGRPGDGRPGSSSRMSVHSMESARSARSASSTRSASSAASVGRRSVMSAKSVELKL